MAIITSEQYDELFPDFQGKLKEDFFSYDDETQRDILEMFATGEDEIVRAVKFQNPETN